MSTTRSIKSVIHGKLTIASNNPIEIHEPTATIVIDGKITIDSEESSIINATNLVITPRGKLSLKNAAMRLSGYLVNHGMFSLSHSQVKASTIYTAGAVDNKNWVGIRKQISWTQLDSHPELSVKEAVKRSNDALAQSSPSVYRNY